MTSPSDKQHFWEILQRMSICMLTTRDGNMLRARPMHAIIEPLIGEVRFIASRDSHKAIEIGGDRQVNVSFLDEGTGCYVSISGTAETTQDRELLGRSWDTDADLWFADGPDSPDAMLIRITPTHAEMWERETNTMRAHWERLTAMGSEKRPDLGDNTKIDF